MQLSNCQYIDTDHGGQLLATCCILTIKYLYMSVCGCQYVHWQPYSDRFNTLRPRQNGRHFLDDIFKCIFLDENVWISIKISLKFVPKVLINNIPALVEIMGWRRSGDKPLSEPMMVISPTHICVTRPQSVNNAVQTHEICPWLGFVCSMNIIMCCGLTHWSMGELNIIFNT